MFPPIHAAICLAHHRARVLDCVTRRIDTCRLIPSGFFQRRVCNSNALSVISLFLSCHHSPRLSLIEIRLFYRV